MQLWISGRFPGLNDIISGQNRQRSGWNAYNDAKQRWFGQIKQLVALKRVQPVGPGYFSLLFVEPNMRRDPDNLVAGGVKLIFDSLVGAEVLAGDGWKHVLGFVGYWVHRADRAGVIVQWDAEKLTSKEAMLAALEKEIGDAHQENRK